MISCKGQNYTTYEKSSRSNENQTDLDIELYLVNKKMEEAYQKTIVYLDSIGTKDAEFYKKELVQSQIGWQDYCESVCIIDDISKETIYLICRINMTESRITEFIKTKKALKDKFNKTEHSK